MGPDIEGTSTTLVLFNIVGLLKVVGALGVFQTCYCGVLEPRCDSATNLSLVETNFLEVKLCKSSLVFSYRGS